MLEHDELDSLLNGIDWDKPLSPLDSNLPTDPDNITLLSSSSPISPVALPNQPPNPLVDKILQSLTKTPIQFTDHPAPSRQESRIKILLPSLCDSKAQSSKPNRKNHNLTHVCQDGSSLIQPLWEHRLRTLEHLFQAIIRFSELKFSNRSEEKVTIGNPILSEGPNTTPAYTTGSLTRFFLGKSIFGIIKDRSIPFRILLYHHRDLWYPCQLSKYSPSNDTESTRTHIQANNLLTNIHNISP